MPSPTSDHSFAHKGAPATEFGGNTWWVIALIVFLGATLRGAVAWHHSPWLDEFHTLFHARSGGLVALIESLARDNHPPLSFALVAIVQPWSEEFHALRLPSLLVGIATIALVALLVRQLAGPRAALLAAALTALSTQHLLSSSEARMYAWLGLGLVGLAEAFAAAERQGRLPWRTSLWLAVALHSHYFALHHIAVGALFVLSWSPARSAATQLLRRRHTWSVLGLGLGLCAPWYLLVFPQQVAHGLWSGGGEASWRALLESYPSLVARRVSLLSLPLCVVVVAAVVALFPLALVGARRLREHAPLTAALLVAQCFALPLWSAALSHVLSRSGFDPKYLSAGGLALIALAAIGAAELARGRKFMALAAALAVPLLALDTRVLADPGAEDYRGAVRRALELVGPRVPLAPIEWQPDLFPRAQGFLYELERADPLPVDFEVVLHNEHYDLSSALNGRDFDGLVVLARGLPDDAPVWQRIEAQFGPRRVERFGVVRAVLYGSAATGAH